MLEANVNPSDVFENDPECARLEAVRRYMALDAPIEPSLERLVRVVTTLFRAPIGLVSLVNESHQVAAACVGLNLRQVERRVSFCAHAIASDNVMVVRDAMKDARFLNNKLVTGAPGIRFYAGAPLITPDGLRLGTLCVMDTKPRERVSRKALQALRDLAVSAMTELELRRTSQLLERANRVAHTVSSRLEAVLAALPDLVFRLSSDGTYLEAHGHPAQFLIPVEQFLGRNAAEVLPLTLAARALEANREALASGRTVSFEYELEGGFWEARVAPCGGDEVITVVRDVSAQRLTESKLRSESAFFNEIASAMGQGLVVVDPNGVLTYANPAFASLIGRAGSDLAGSRLADLTHKSQQLLLHRLLEQNRAGIRASGTVRLRQASGWADVLLTCVPRRTDAGDEGSVIVAIDLSERVRFERSLERERNFSHAITEDTEFVVVVTDAAGRVTRLNPCAARLLETTEAQARGQAIWTLLRDPDAVRLAQRAMRRLQRSRRVAAGELQWSDTLGQVRHASLSCSVLNDREHRLAHIVVTGIDTTILRRSEASRERAQQAIEQANRARSEFLNHVSHELRTPLHAISGFCDLLMDAESDELSAEQTGFAEEIQRAANHLFALISDLLDLSKLSAGAVTLEPRVLGTTRLLRDSLAFVDAGVRRAGLHTSLTVQPGSEKLFGGERQLRQIMINLLANAVKFTPAGGHVDISTSLEGDFLRISVADTGIGLPPEDLHRIFEAFAQASNSPTHQRSFGLGLSLAQRLADLHGGRIEVSSRLGQGSVFTLVLPCAPRGAKTR